jgi:hypothetical protein
MTGPAVAFPVRVRLAPNADTGGVDVQASVARAVDARMRAFGVPGHATVTVEAGGAGLELTLGSAPARTAGPEALAVLPAESLIRAMVNATTIEYCTETTVDRLWALAGSPAGESPPRWFGLMVQATVWAGGHAGDPGTLAAVARRALAAPDADRDPDVLAEEMLRHYPRYLDFAAAEETLPRLAALLREPADGTGPWQQMSQQLGALASFAPAAALRPDPLVEAGQVAIRLGGIELGVLPVPATGTMIACVAPRHLTGMDGMLGAVQVAGQQSAREGWSLLRSDSPAARYVADADPALTDHLGTGAAALLLQRRHWLPTVGAVTSALTTLVESSAYQYSVWFARQYLSDAQITAVLRLLLAAEVPVEELPLVLRDLFVALQAPGAELATGPPTVSRLAELARAGYVRRSSGERWDPSPEPSVAASG